mmetsp:Transcript_19610/g.54737  ORF Transcript_19610/g.54737 Transcript_19610/m.54737 type:complete len:640 (+) Transcript_19610:523-2442(+)|eukprot:CAMPEP_0172360110 /NCGR_PEP_ID=MMETSP1060-20121228/4203_1 /TAXON_ID=37318 /ORGANISM="Pseudo-nitzschia pungens, Strain cf. cingulata" /LENGTH=639 /DNA_ID=CAMNT_0013082007 /DNA_START=431 /DNA_END=2350 /DNA_ORIENTATION=-
MRAKPIVMLPVFVLALIAYHAGWLSSLTVVADAVADAECVDDGDFLFRFKKRSRSCLWLAGVTNSHRKFLICNKKKGEQKQRVKKHCQSACNFKNCVNYKDSDTNNFQNTCVDDATFRFRWKNGNRSCNWLSKVSNKYRRTTLCNDVEEFCQSACNYDDCLNKNIHESSSPTLRSTKSPTLRSTHSPTRKPSAAPTRNPTSTPTGNPTFSPTRHPTSTPTTGNSTAAPTRNYTAVPTPQPSGLSTLPSAAPSSRPSHGQVFGGGKKGACWTLRDEWRPGSYVENLPKLRALVPSWVYSWSQIPADGVPLAVAPDGRGIRIPGNDTYSSPPFWIDFVPMLWGYYSSTFDRYTDDIRAQNPFVVLGFNEPDSTAQSDISVDAAIEGWSRLVNKVTEGRIDTDSDDILLVSPSPVNPLGQWFRSFMDGIHRTATRVDAIGIHWYAEPNERVFAQRLRQVYELYGRPLVVTEFAVADFGADSIETNRYPPERVLSFLQKILPWMEEQDWILGYSWFSFDQRNPVGTSSALFVSNTTNVTVGGARTNGPPVLTPLGEYYAAFTGGGGDGIDIEEEDDDTTSPSPPLDDPLVGIEGSSGFQHIDRGDWWLIQPQKRSSTRASKWALTSTAWDARSMENQIPVRFR